MMDNDHQQSEHEPSDAEKYFQQVCWRLRQNDPSIQVVDWSLVRMWMQYRPNDIPVYCTDQKFMQLGDALASNTHVRSLKLEDDDWDQVTARGANRFARRVCRSRIEHLELTGGGYRIEGGGGGDNNDVPSSTVIPKELYGRIHQSKTIQTLEISRTMVDMTTLANVLTTKHDSSYLRLTSLSLELCPLSTDQMKILSVGLRDSSSIKELILPYCRIDNDGVNALCQHFSENKTLRCLNLVGNVIGPSGARQLMTTIANHSTLWELNIDGNSPIGYRGLKLIGDELPHVSIGLLRVSYISTSDPESNLNDEACFALAEGIRRNVSLEELYLQSNNLSAFGLQAIMRGLANHTTMRKLDLSENATVDDLGIKLIGEELGNVKLDEINLSVNMKHSTSEILAEARKEAFLTLIEGIEQNSSLREFQFCYNDLSPVEAQLLMQATAHHISLTKLIIHGNSTLGIEGLKMIADELAQGELEAISLGCVYHDWKATADQKTAVTKVGQTLADAMKRNIFLRRLEMDDRDREGWKSWIKPHLDEVEFYLDLNRTGRYELCGDDDDDDEVTIALWPNILAYSQDNASRMYYFLREQPWLVPFKW